MPGRRLSVEPLSGLSVGLDSFIRVWRYKQFRRSPDSPRTPNEWVDALLEDGWETWCGRGAWHVLHGTDVYGVWLRRFEPTPGRPTWEATLAVSGAPTRTR